MSWLDQSFFIKQNIQNACGTIALLHALCNTKEHCGGFVEDSFLDKFTTIGATSSPEERAYYLNQDL